MPPCLDLPGAAEALAAIVAAPLAWSSTAVLASKGVPRPVLDDLAAAELLARWDRLDAWTLTPYAATVVNMRLVERGPRKAPCWSGPGQPAPAKLPVEQRRFDLDALDPAVPPKPHAEPYVDSESGEPLVLFAGRAVVHRVRGTGWHRKPMHRSLAS